MDGDMYDGLLLITWVFVRADICFTPEILMKSINCILTSMKIFHLCANVKNTIILLQTTTNVTYISTCFPQCTSYVKHYEVDCGKIFRKLKVK